MDFFAAHINDGAAAVALLIIRMAMVPFCVYNVAWSFKGFRQFIRGISYPSSLYQSVVFFFSTGLLGYHLLSFAGRTTSVWSVPYSLTLQCLFFLSMICALIGRKVATTIDFDKFYWLFASNNLDVAVRIAEMNELDGDYVQHTLELAEASFPMYLAKKNRNGHDQ